MTRYSIYGYEQPETRDIAQRYAAKKWREYQSKYRVGGIRFGTVVVTIVFFVIAVTIYPIFGLTMTVVALLGGSWWTSKNNLQARMKFENDYPKIAKLVR
ncbi:MAG: hypothetical protein AAB517_00890 [Patescibacteria group bacterium]